MRLIKGNLADIEQQLHSLPIPEASQRIWLGIEIATDTYLSDMQQHIQQVNAHIARRRVAVTTQP